MALLLPLFPSYSLSGFPFHKKPTFASLVKSPKSGREATGFQQIFPLWEFDLSFEILRDQSQNQTPFTATLGFTDFQALSGFWVERAPPFGLFIYQDLKDFSKTGQIIGTGNGVIATFSMVRTFGTGTYSLTEPVGIVDVRTGKVLNVYLNGVLLAQPGNWTIDQNLHMLRFASPPGGGITITADFDYFYLCRFIGDSIELEEFMVGRWTIKSLRFRSTRPTLTDYTIANINSSLITP